MTTQYIRYDHKMNMSEAMIPMVRPLLKIVFKKQIIYGTIYVSNLYHGLYIL